MLKGYCIAVSRLSSTAVGIAGQSTSHSTGGMLSCSRHGLVHSRPVLRFVLTRIVGVIWVVIIVSPIVVAHFKIRILLFGMPGRPKIDKICKGIAGKDQGYDPFEDRRNILVFSESRSSEDYC